MILYIIIVLLMGLVTPIQTAANARLRVCVGYAYVSTLVSFAVSALALVAVSLLVGAPIVPTEQQMQQVPWWGWTGGIIALFTITANILLFKAIGQLQAMVLPLFGQLLFSLAIDHYGLFSARVIPLSLLRFVGMAIVFGGVFLVAVLPNLRRWQAGTETSIWHQTAWQLLGVFSGILQASIGAIYGRLGTVLSSAMQATTISFIIAVAVILLICLLTGKINTVGKAFRRTNPWWMWLGGIIGATSVFVHSLTIPVIGVGLFSVALLLGQLTLSLGMEHHGWLGAPRKSVSPAQLFGLVLMMLGIVMIRT